MTEIIQISMLILLVGSTVSMIIFLLGIGIGILMATAKIRGEQVKELKELKKNK